MFNKPIDNILKAQFETIHSDAIKRAEKDFKVNVLDKSLNLVHFDKFELLVSEENRIEDLIDKNNYPYYVKNHSSEDWLLTQFSSRYFLLNIDESEELKEAVYLGKYHYLVRENISALKKKIPKFTFDEFTSGKVCKYLNSYDYYYNIDKEDYYKIVTWQSDNLIKIVSYEVKLLVENHQKYCSTISTPLDFINEQIQILEEELTKSLNNAQKLKSSLSKLFAFKGVDVENYNDDLLLFNYPSFFNDRIEFKRLNPSTVNELLNKLSNKPKKIFSNEYVIFYTLDVFLSWLKDIIKGKSIQEPFLYPEWEVLLNQIIDEAKQEILTTIENINNNSYNPNNSKKVTRHYLLNEFEKQISKYNNIENKSVFYLLRDENRNALISDFKINAIFNNKKDQYLKEIREAYILQNISWEISSIYQDIFDSRSIYFKNDRGGDIIINILMNQMVLDKEIYKELGSALDDFLKDMHYLSLPLDFHFYNHHKISKILFEKSIARLQDILNDAEPNNKVLYIQSRLKDLRHRELKFRTLFETKKNLKDKVNKYPNLFKEFLSIEADYIKETVHISPITFLPYPTKKLLINKADSFKTFVSIEKQDYILKLLEDLSITSNGKSTLTQRKKGAIRGIVAGLKEKSIIPNIGLAQLCNIIAEKIELELNSELNSSNISDDYKIITLAYIKDTPIH